MNCAETRNLDDLLEAALADGWEELRYQMADAIDAAYEAGRAEGYEHGREEGYAVSWRQALESAAERLPEATETQADWLNREAEDPGADSWELPDTRLDRTEREAI